MKIGFGKKIGLALGGGAVRGFAHIGVLKALDEAGIRPSYVAGTSAGSLVGSLFCAGLSWKEIIEATRDLDWKDLVNPSIPSMGLVKAENLENIIDRLVRKRGIEALEIPFRAVATDLVSGRAVVFSRGPVGLAVRASCSIPGIFIPIEDGERLLVDGGIVNNVPADVAADMGAEFVIAVDVASGNHVRRPGSIAEVMFRSMNILIARTASLGLSKVDLVVRPDIAEFSFHDASKRFALIDKGEAAMKQALLDFRP
jgi:NTE family protein